MMFEGQIKCKEADRDAMYRRLSARLATIKRRLSEIAFEWDAPGRLEFQLEVWQRRLSGRPQTRSSAGKGKTMKQTLTGRTALVITLLAPLKGKPHQ